MKKNSTALLSTVVRAGKAYKAFQLILNDIFHMIFL